MVAPLEHVLVQRPTAAFESAFDNPAHGYLHPVEFESAHKEHEEFCELLTSLDVIVHQLDGDFSSPDLIYSRAPLMGATFSGCATDLLRWDVPSAPTRPALTSSEECSKRRCIPSTFR